MVYVNVLTFSIAHEAGSATSQLWLAPEIGIQNKILETEYILKHNSEETSISLIESDSNCIELSNAANAEYNQQCSSANCASVFEQESTGHRICKWYPSNRSTRK